MKYIVGFFMAWGNFCSLPCPYKRWNGDYKSVMLGFLPSIGFLIGIIWAAIYYGLVTLGFPFLVVSFILTFIPFALSGFTHMDGFMDCCDAIGSMRSIEEKQRILKDSHTGAFAVICTIFLVLGFFSFISTSLTTGIDYVNLIIIVVLSRSVSGLHVLICKPMGQSQYAALEKTAEKTEETGSDENPTKQSSKKEGIVLIFVQLAIILTTAFILSRHLWGTLIVGAAVAFGSSLAILRGRKQLGGMSGDIAGYGIVWGEFAGVIALIFC